MLDRERPNHAGFDSHEVQSTKANQHTFVRSNISDIEQLRASSPWVRQAQKSGIGRKDRWIEFAAMLARRDSRVMHIILEPEMTISSDLKSVKMKSYLIS